ncbi:MAG: hypothetical protein WC208_12140, partial [Gallionella sp.]
MSLFALIVALLLEQLKPLCSNQYLYGWLSGYVEYFQHHFNSGEYTHGKIAWWLAVLPITVGSVLVFWGLYYLHPILAWVFNVIALYLCLGFGQFSHCFTDIQLALSRSKIDEARELLSTLRGRASNRYGKNETRHARSPHLNPLPQAGEGANESLREFSFDELNAEEIARVTIEASLVALLHHLFGVIVWFVLFSLLGLGGAAGALFYCLCRALRTHWQDEFSAQESGDAQFDGFARKMSARLEWLPIRMTAATFAVVGNFEDTVYCWRSQAASWPDSETGILLASAAGASGVRLGLPIPQDGTQLNRPELGVGN